MGHYCIRIVMICSLALTGVSSVRAESNPWKVVTDDDGVTAWTKESGDGLPMARASTAVDAPFCEVLAVIRDIERHCEWMADCVATRVLARHDWQHIDMYLRIKGHPWVGVNDRDAVLKTRTVMAKPGSEVEVEFSVAAADTTALGSDTVHMPRLSGSYRLRRLAADKTEVVYQFHADLGGWVPGWVGTRTVEQLPWRTLIGLRRHVGTIGGVYRAEIESWPLLDSARPCGPSEVSHPGP